MKKDLDLVRPDSLIAKNWSTKLRKFGIACPLNLETYSHSISIPMEETWFQLYLGLQIFYLFQQRINVIFEYSDLLHLFL